MEFYRHDFRDSSKKLKINPDINISMGKLFYVPIIHMKTLPGFL